MTSQTATPGFVHLHVHTHYSLLDGANRIGELVQRAKTLEMPAIAITDHGNMFGAVEFYRAATKAGVKPIIGLEAYIAPGDRRNKDAKGKESNYHLLLLAMNNVGYHNLLKLTTIGYREGFYYKPRIDREVLEAHAEGLICTSTCLGAEIPQALIKRDRAAAEQTTEWYLKVFGPDRFFIELQDHGIDEQRQINPELIDIVNNVANHHAQRVVRDIVDDADLQRVCIRLNVHGGGHGSRRAGAAEQRQQAAGSETSCEQLAWRTHGVLPSCPMGNSLEQT